MLFMFRQVVLHNGHAVAVTEDGVIRRFGNWQDGEQTATTMK